LHFEYADEHFRRMLGNEEKVKRIAIPKAIFILVAISLLVTLLSLYQAKQSQKMISEFGKYQGYSEEMYDGSTRTSDYLTLSDGTQLAYDLFLPTKSGVPADKQLPVLFKYTPYGRAWTVFDQDGRAILCDLYPVWWCELGLRFRGLIVSLFGGNGQVQDALNRTEWLGQMVNSGYAVIVVDRPGTGASFGKYNGDPDIAANETNEILNWIAAQPWSNGEVGMFGDSIQAQIQFRAASTGNPHLKAILPATTWMDNYSAAVFPGGIRNTALTNFYVMANETFDLMATPVDQDKEGSLLAQARAERQNTSVLANAVADIGSLPYRDSLIANGEEFWTHSSTLYPLLDKINRSGTPVYLINGWYDLYAGDNFLIYENLTVPKRLLVRPTDHAGIEANGSDVDYGAEAHRWFDYWLKGIDNGIMDEPPIHYYLQGVDTAQAWQSADLWPLENQEIFHYYFSPAQSDEHASINNGALVPTAPSDKKAFDEYVIDYTATTGVSPLWSGLATSHKYPNMNVHDSKSLTYTTSPLDAPLKIVGHPTIHLWLSTSAKDLDVFVYLEEVDYKGNSTYITEGELRASHRLLSEAPFDNFGMPWHNYFQTELQSIPTREPIELIFSLRPTAWQFAEGSRIRISVAFTDAGNFDTPILDPEPSLQLMRNTTNPSYIEVPIARAP
jgi:putative CocE/NonD family hydrolase